MHFKSIFDIFIPVPASFRGGGMGGKGSRYSHVLNREFSQHTLLCKLQVHHIGLSLKNSGPGDRSDASAALAYLARSYANFSVKSSRLHCEYGLMYFVFLYIRVPEFM